MEIIGFCFRSVLLTKRLDVLDSTQFSTMINWFLVIIWNKRFSTCVVVFSLFVVWNLFRKNQWITDSTDYEGYSYNLSFQPTVNHCHAYLLHLHYYAWNVRPEEERKMIIIIINKNEKMLKDNVRLNFPESSMDMEEENYVENAIQSPPVGFGAKIQDDDRCDKMPEKQNMKICLSQLLLIVLIRLTAMRKQQMISIRRNIHWLEDENIFLCSTYVDLCATVKNV